MCLAATKFGLHCCTLTTRPGMSDHDLHAEESSQHLQLENANYVSQGLHEPTWPVSAVLMLQPLRQPAHGLAPQPELAL